ncbi:MAG: tetratricopeptide repeat protein [Saprospiraceae bacterium]|nr:tetratricopeptide repeat protein [Saprospiraceae bacterium]
MNHIFQKALTLLVSGLFVCFFSPMAVRAQPTLRFTRPAMEAHRAITRLEFSGAREILRDIKRQDPRNAVGDFLQFELDFLGCLTSEEPMVLDRFQRLAQGRIDRIQKVSDTEVWKHFCLGEMYMMRGILASRRQAYLQAVSDIRKGYQATQTGLKRFPRFLPCRRDAAVLRILMGTLPDRYQWALEWISGIDGDLVEGIEELRGIRRILSKQGHFLSMDTGFLEAVISHYILGQREEALALGETLYARDPDHPLLLFLLATLQQENGYNDVTIRLLSQRIRDPRRAPFPYLEYLTGKAYLYALNFTAAEHAIEDFLESWPGTSLRADALQKLAWCSLLQGNTAGYTRMMAQCAAIKESSLDQDKQAQLDAVEGIVPHTDLLRARLLFDGGYLDRTTQVLDGIDVASFHRESERIEYAYRRGRMAQVTGQFDQAIQHFTQCWEEGREASFHYACAGSLQAGNIYLGRGQSLEARKWYQRCLDLSPDRYRDGLHQKAKAGLLQLER